MSGFSSDETTLNPARNDKLKAKENQRHRGTGVATFSSLLWRLISFPSESRGAGRRVALQLLSRSKKHEYVTTAGGQ